ncbi:hypothetical protein AC579_110 [Pseudocercospora musae]|uniref:Uncharacterized protein n=1 Tax=Pseudocercospora musae TaxID=113226 RepID=A0A139GTC3_9PEZI|nr:hypothetical protein AC579_110 [Pseudocercospora musae]
MPVFLGRSLPQYASFGPKVLPYSTQDHSQTWYPASAIASLTRLEMLLDEELLGEKYAIIIPPVEKHGPDIQMFGLVWSPTDGHKFQQRDLVGAMVSATSFNRQAQLPMFLIQHASGWVESGEIPSDLHVSKLRAGMLYHRVDDDRQFCAPPAALSDRRSYAHRYFSECPADMPAPWSLLLCLRCRLLIKKFVICAAILLMTIHEVAPLMKICSLLHPAYLSLSWPNRNRSMLAFWRSTIASSLTAEASPPFSTAAEFTKVPIDAVRLPLNWCYLPRCSVSRYAYLLFTTESMISPTLAFWWCSDNSPFEQTITCSLHALANGYCVTKIANFAGFLDLSSWQSSRSVVLKRGLLLASYCLGIPLGSRCCKVWLQTATMNPGHAQCQVLRVGCSCNHAIALNARRVSCSSVRALAVAWLLLHSSCSVRHVLAARKSWMYDDRSTSPQIGILLLVLGLSLFEQLTVADVLLFEAGSCCPRSCLRCAQLLVSCPLNPLMTLNELCTESQYRCTTLLAKSVLFGEPSPAHNSRSAALSTRLSLPKQLPPMPDGLFATLLTLPSIHNGHLPSTSRHHCWEGDCCEEQ